MKLELEVFTVPPLSFWLNSFIQKKKLVTEKTPHNCSTLALCSLLLSTSISWSASINVPSNTSASVPADYPSDTYDDINIEEDGTFRNNGTLTVDNNLLNDGSLENNSNLTITNQTTNSNFGTLTNSGILNTSSFTNRGNMITSGTFNNSTLLVNRGAIMVTGTLNSTNPLENDSGYFSIGDGGTGGEVNADINNGGYVVFNRSDDSTYTGIISMPTTEIGGEISKQGSGQLTMSGLSNATGGTTIIEAGELYLTGGLRTSDVTVQSNGTLSGRTASISPFEKAGYVASLTFEPDATYIARPAPNPAADEYISVNYGITDLSTAHLIIQLAPGNYTSDIRHTLLISSDGTDGQFASTTISPPNPRLQYTLRYEPTGEVYATFSSLPTPLLPLGNPGSVAHYISTNAPESLKNSLNSLTLSDLTKALNDLSPAPQTQKADMVGNTEINQMSAPFTYAGMDRLINRVTYAEPKLITALHSFKESFNRLFASKLQHRSPMAKIVQSPDAKHLPTQSRIAFGKATLWVQGAAGRVTHHNVPDDSGLSVHGLEGNTADTSMGIDYAFRPDFKAGLTTGYTHSRFKTNVNGDRGGTNSLRLGVYGLWEGKKTYINGAAYYGHHQFKGERKMTVISAVAHHKHNGHHLSALGEIGWDIMLSQRTTVTPYMSVGVLHLTEKKYKETGAGDQSLVIHGRHGTTVQGKIGAQFSKLWEGDKGTLAYSFMRLGVTSQRTFRKNQKITAHLINQGGEFSVITKNSHRLLFNPSLGITANLTSRLSATVAYEGTYHSMQRTHQALLKFNWLI
ncbi:MAG: autotransporter domain-containing protein [Candidatus Paracaedibacteraceae bacterium]|nr:autotransporter domain-containing protein [Candidatus Paracaedibacteraceae bacterium]